VSGTGRRGPAGVVLEGLATGMLGAGLGWAALSQLEFLTAGAAVAGAAVGSLNGLISGGTGMYEWRGVRGWLCFLADSTWALLGTASGLALHLANTFDPDPSYVVGMSRRSNRHVYEAGFSMRPGFALALGNVVSGAGGTAGLRGESRRAVRRRKLVDVHEGAHLFQNRLLGPIYPLVYLAWMSIGALVGLVVSLVGERRHVWKVVETLAYYDNPFEYWAYRKDDYWPPAGAHPRYAWGARRLRRSRR